MRTLSIGALALETGVKVPTIRFYEQIELLPAPPRSDGNRRLFDEAAVRRLRFIRHARDLGFEIDDIRQLLALSDQPDRSCGEVDAVARHHLDSVDRRIAQLQALRGELARMVDECAGGSVGKCRIIEVISDHLECRVDRDEPIAGPAARRRQGRAAV